MDMDDKLRIATRMIQHHRESIDRLDAILVYTLAERFMHTKDIGRIKAEYNLPPADPSREVCQIDRLKKLALAADLDQEFAQKFIQFIIQEVIRNHELHRTR